MSNLPLLSILIWLPIVGALAIFILGGERRPLLAQRIAFLTSLITIVLCIPLWQGFDSQSVAFQFVENKAWLPNLNINYALGIDGFALPLIILTCFFTPIVILAAWNTINKQIAHYMAAFLVMQGLMCGVFSAIDSILFYVFWESMLIPMFLIIGIWGGPQRIYATIKFFLYTFFGSIFLLIAIIYLYSLTSHQGLAEPFSILTFHQVKIDIIAQKWIFFAFLIAFAVKVPMWPVHTWLPDAHVQAPTGGSVILAAIMLKMGAYGFLRFILPIVPDASRMFSFHVIVLSLIGVVYIGFVAITQKDMKKLIAYSSIAHMGFVTLGFFLVFSLTSNSFQHDAAIMGIEGAYVQMISHGFISAAMFLCIGVLYEQMHSREIMSYGGVASKMPWFAVFYILFAMGNIGLPGTSGFVGEFFVILAAFQSNIWFAFFAAMTLILGAIYTLWMVKRVLWGEITNESVQKLNDINAKQALYLSILAFMVLLIGLWPHPLIEVTQQSVQQLINHIELPKY